MIFTDFDKALALELFAGIRAWTQDDKTISICRPSYGQGETQALQEVALAARRRGLTTNIDMAGNLVMTVGEKHPENPIVMGSHLDAVPNGGNYDGLAGVVAALLVLIKAKEQKVTQSLMGLGLRGEESAWFGTPYIGSKALFGKLTPQDLKRNSSVASSLEYAMRTCHADIDKILSGKRLLPPVREFWELHIEQGPVLAQKKVPVGIVDAIRGNIRAPKARVLGEAGHSGTTPHHLRKDAVLRFAEMLAAGEAYRASIHERGHDIVSTCGKVGTNPSKHSMTTIADEVEFSLDIRSTDMITAKTLFSFFKRHAGDTVDWGDVVQTEGMIVDSKMVARARAFATGLGIEFTQLPSGAGHDAAIFNQEGIPSGMVFVRNFNGSHNPREAMDIEDFMKGVEVLYATVTA